MADAIRLSTPGIDDVAALAALKGETFTETFGPANDAAEVATHVRRAFAVDVVAAELANPESVTWWLRDGDDPVGYLKLNVGTAQSEPGLTDGLEVEQVYVRASHQGHRLGARLLDLAADVARERGLSFVWLSVWERNERAIAVYEHRGFEAFGEHVFMMGDEPQRDLLMRVSV